MKLGEEVFRFANTLIWQWTGKRSVVSYDDIRANGKSKCLGVCVCACVCARARIIEKHGEWADRERTWENECKREIEPRVRMRRWGLPSTTRDEQNTWNQIEKTPLRLIEQKSHSLFRLCRGTRAARVWGRRANLSRKRMRISESYPLRFD